MAIAAIDHIFSLFERFGSNGYGEDVSQLQHALQVANAAQRDGCSDALIAAALLHDVGQFINDAGNAAERQGKDARHEIIGAELLSASFSEAVTEPVRLHVDAKRYLCAVRPGYFDGLSRASRISLRVQGGPFTLEEARAFESQPFFADAIRLREYDEGGKDRARDVPGLESYRPLLERLLV